MDSRFVGVSVLGVVGVMAAMASLDVIKRTGPKMCDHLCRNRIGCSSYLFMPSDLSCQVTNVSVTQHNPDKGVYFFSLQKKVEKVVGKNTTCQQNSRIHHTRRNGLKCEYVRANQRHGEGLKRRGGRTKKIFVNVPLSRDIPDMLDVITKGNISTVFIDNTTLF